MLIYYQRLIEKEIALKLKSSGAVVVAGPKFCGKTTTCMLYQKSFVKLNTKQAIAMARMNPKAVLVGETPRLIDEWQKAPDIWNQVKDDLGFCKKKRQPSAPFLLMALRIIRLPNLFR